MCMLDVMVCVLTKHLTAGHDLHDMQAQLDALTLLLLGLQQTSS